MKHYLSSIFKIIVIVALIYYSPIKEGCYSFLKGHLSSEALLYNSDMDISIDSTLLLVDRYSYDYIEKPSNTIASEKSLPVTMAGSIQNVLIYSTHQNEEYLDYGGVTSAAEYLAEELRGYGIEVDVIEENFLATASMYGYGYNQLYRISRMFLKEYLSNSSYDLVIDFHRDALPRESTYITYEGVNYAVIMADIGINNPNYLVNLSYAQSLTDKISSYGVPIMKPVYTIASTYNQDLGDSIMLIEFGSDTNYYEEVLNSIEIVARAIKEIRW